MSVVRNLAPPEETYLVYFCTARRYLIGSMELTKSTTKWSQLLGQTRDVKTHDGKIVQITFGTIPMSSDLKVNYNGKDYSLNVSNVTGDVKITNENSEPVSYLDEITTSGRSYFLVDL